MSDQLKELIREVPDFPKQGISFKDITTLLKNAGGLQQAIDEMVGLHGDAPVDAIVGVESRGFVVGTPLALKMGCGFIPIRKPGKLPAETISEEYMLEYGTDTIEIHSDALSSGDRVLIVDDLLATGGTMEAACKLVERLGAKIVGISFLVELAFLNGRQKLAEYQVRSVINY